MRFLLVLAATLAVAAGCSSNDDTPAATPPNACVQAGGFCPKNFPYSCYPNFDEAADTTLATACGKTSEEPIKAIPCCVTRTTPIDTGVPEDTSTDATDATDDSSASDSASDSASEAAPEAGDASEAG